MVNPQRWRQADGTPGNDKRVTLPFGAGLRTCP